MRQRSLKAAIVATASVALAATGTPAQATPLDPSFGNGGIATFATPNRDENLAMVVQPDGKIVVGGSTQDPASAKDFALVRFNPDGTLDSSFGGDGFVQTSLSTNIDEVTGLAMDGNKIVAAGYVDPAGADEDDVAVARYNPDGSLDTDTDADPGVAFGTGGKGTVVHNAAGASDLEDYAEAVTVGTGGQIFIAAGLQVDTVSDYDFALVRVSSTGFVNSVSTQNISTDTDREDYTEAMIQQPDGKLVLAGESDLGAGTDNFAFSFARFNPDGSLDSGAGADTNPADSFGTVGVATVDFTAARDVARALARQPDGKLVAGGQSNLAATGNDFAVARLTADGAIDNGAGAFSDDGKLTTAIAAGTGNDALNSVAVQPDGKIVAGGSSATNGLTLVRYTPAGALDTSFDFDGIVTTSNVTRAFSLASSGSKLIAGGEIDPDGPGGDISNFAVARYHQNDRDSDGAADEADNCPDTASGDQSNFDGDTQGDPCDEDDDNDGTPDASDGCPNSPGPSAGCPFPDPGDRDGDGVVDANDACPTVAAATPNGCPPDPPGPIGPTNGNDILTGDAAANTVCGLLGDDTIRGLGGNDTLFGDNCDDRRKPAGAAQAGADGDDTLVGGTGNDALFGAGGNDELDGERGNDRLFGGDGNDRMVGGPGNDRLSGGNGRDKLTGGSGRNAYSGGGGNDTISAVNRRRDTVNCGAGRRDSATVDRADRVRGCERVRRRRR